MSKPNVKARRKRLLVLADFLEGTVLPMLDGAKFHMGTWGDTYDGAVPREIGRTKECGFAGCAMGWGYYSPALRRAGIRSTIGPNSFTEELSLVYDEDSGDTKAAEFFGLDEHEFNCCFMPGSYRGETPTGKRGIRRVVKRLREVANRQPVTL